MYVERSPAPGRARAITDAINNNNNYYYYIINQVAGLNERSEHKCMRYDGGHLTAIQGGATAGRRAGDRVLIAVARAQARPDRRFPRSAFVAGGSTGWDPPRAWAAAGARGGEAR